MSASRLKARTVPAWIALCSLCASCAPAEETATITPCTIGSDQEIIDAAIGYSVMHAIDRRERIEHGECNNPGRPPGAPCLILEPYFSVSEFKEKNPDRCVVLKKTDPKTPMYLRPYIEGRKHPKVYQVKMRYIRFYYEDGKPTSDVHRPVVEVDCRGTVLWGSLPRP